MGKLFFSQPEPVRDVFFKHRRNAVFVVQLKYFIINKIKIFLLIDYEIIVTQIGHNKYAKD